MLATLKISKAVDENGHQITPNPEMTTGLERYVGLCCEVSFLKMLNQANKLCCGIVIRKSFLVCLSREMRGL